MCSVLHGRRKEFKLRHSELPQFISSHRQHLVLFSLIFVYGTMGPLAKQQCNCFNIIRELLNLTKQQSHAA